MDLDPLQPEEPPVGETPAVPVSSWAWNDPAARDGADQWAPPPTSENGPGEHAPWATDAPAGAADGTPSRFSRRTKVLAGATALVMCAAAAWAAGTASGTHTPTVRIEPAVAASGGSNSSSGATGSTGASGSTGPGARGSWGGAHRGGRFGGGMFMGGGATGTVATIDLSALSFTVSRPARPTPPSSSAGSSATPSVTPTPTPVTVTTTGTTTYTEFESSTFTSTDAPVGARIAAFGTRNPDGSLTATTISVMPTGTGFTPHAKAPSSTGSAGTSTPKTSAPKTIPANAAARLAKAPFAIGQVTATSSASGSSTTLTLTTPWGTEMVDTTSATTFTTVVTTNIGFSTLAVGQRVVIRGQRQSNGDVAASSVMIIPAGVTLSPLGFGPSFAGRGFVAGPLAGGRGPWGRFGGAGQRPPAPAPAAAPATAPLA